MGQGEKTYHLVLHCCLLLLWSILAAISPQKMSVSLSSEPVAIFSRASMTRFVSSCSSAAVQAPATHQEAALRVNPLDLAFEDSKTETRTLSTTLLVLDVVPVPVSAVARHSTDRILHPLPLRTKQSDRTDPNPYQTTA